MAEYKTEIMSPFAHGNVTIFNNENWQGISEEEFLSLLTKRSNLTEVVQSMIYFLHEPSYEMMVSVSESYFRFLFYFTYYPISRYHPKPFDITKKTRLIESLFATGKRYAGEEYFLFGNEAYTYDIFSGHNKFFLVLNCHHLPFTKDVTTYHTSLNLTKLKQLFSPSDLTAEDCGE